MFLDACRIQLHTYPLLQAEPAGDGAATARALLQAPRQQQQLQQRRQQAAPLRQADRRVEDAILQTYAPPGMRQPGAQQRAEEAQRRVALKTAGAGGAGERRRPNVGAVGGGQATPAQRAAQEAAQAALLVTQQRQVAAQDQQREAARQEQLQAASLGRGSLRARGAQQASRQPLVRGSNRNDIFAQHTERALRRLRERLAQQQQAWQAQQARQAAAGVQGRGQAQAAPLRQRAHQQQRTQQQQVQQQQAQQQEAMQQQQGLAAAAPGRPRHHIPAALILAMTLVMAAAAGLGALPFFFVRTMSPAATGLATAVACGVMLAASFDLVHDGE